MSGLLCFCVSILIVALHLVLLSVNYGTALPQFFDGEWAVGYTEKVVQPLQELFGNLVFNNILIILLWGLAGLSVYFLGEYILHLRRRWRRAAGDIQLVGQQVVAHPGRESFMTTVIWRVTVLVIAALVFIAVQPLVENLLNFAPDFVAGGISVKSGLTKLLIALIGWTVLLQIFVVFLRLFLMRTRLFGDPAIE